MKRTIAFLLSIVVSAAAQQPSGQEILERIDENMSTSSRVLTSKMIIHSNRGSRTIVSKTWNRGLDESFTEYLSPAREKGTKMLKLGDRLWIYSPATDRTIQISGHMLRQSVMGSDLSYEDLMEDPKLSHLYDARVVAADTVGDRPCYVLELAARTKDIAYFRRRLWVDRERFVPLRQKLFAKSGKLLKRMELSDVRQEGWRWFPARMLFKDVLKSGRGTEFIIESIEFDVNIPDYIFSKAALRR